MEQTLEIALDSYFEKPEQCQKILTQLENDLNFQSKMINKKMKVRPEMPDYLHRSYMEPVSGFNDEIRIGQTVNSDVIARLSKLDQEITSKFWNILSSYEEFWPFYQECPIIDTQLLMRANYSCWLTALLTEDMDKLIKSEEMVRYSQFVELWKNRGVLEKLLKETCIQVELNGAAQGRLNNDVPFWSKISSNCILTGSYATMLAELSFDPRADVSKYAPCQVENCPIEGIQFSEFLIFEDDKPMLKYDGKYYNVSPATDIDIMVLDDTLNNEFVSNLFPDKSFYFHNEVNNSTWNECNRTKIRSTVGLHRETSLLEATEYYCFDFYNGSEEQVHVHHMPPARIYLKENTLFIDPAAYYALKYRKCLNVYATFSKSKPINSKHDRTVQILSKYADRGFSIPQEYKFLHPYESNCVRVYLH